jgi:glycosyltransferase involved in cell wall biosynthesis
MNRVVIHRNLLLARSETFIRDQAIALTRWEPVLTGKRRVDDGLPLDELNVRILPRQHTRLGRNLITAMQLVGMRTPATRMLQSIDPALVHVHFGLDAVDIWPMVQILDVPMLVTLHGYDITIRSKWWESGKGGANRKGYPEMLLRLSREPRVHFLAVSEALRKKAIEFGLPESKVTTCYTGIYTDRFRPDSTRYQRSPKVLFVGRLVEKKGVAFLIEACSRIFPTIPGARLAIAGDGPLRAELTTLAASKHVPVDFIGFVGSDEVRALMATARVFCLPSVTAASGDTEGFGMVLLEAQACGVPVVSSALGGATEGLRDGVTGFRVKEGDVAGLAERLQELLVDDSLHSRMSAAAVGFVRENFDVRRCIATLETLYDRAVAGDL